MGKDILTFGDTEVEKYEFYCHKRPIFLKDVGIEEVLVSKKISSDEKKNYNRFIGYLYNDHKIESLHKMLPKTSAYVKRCD